MRAESFIFSMALWLTPDSDNMQQPFLRCVLAASREAAICASFTWTLPPSVFAAVQHVIPIWAHYSSLCGPRSAALCCLLPLKWLPALLVCLRKPLLGRKRAGFWSLVVCGWWRQGWRENGAEPVNKGLMWWSRRDDKALRDEEDERKTCFGGKWCF